MCGIAERASARETAARTAAGALAGQLLANFGISVFGYVVQIGAIAVAELVSQTTSVDALGATAGLSSSAGDNPRKNTAGQASSGTRRDARDRSELYTLDPDQDEALKKLIDGAAKRGDTLGGAVEVRAEGVPFGLGSHAQWDRRLDGRLAQAVMSVQSVKGVEIGLGFESAGRFGSETHDPIGYDPALADGPTLGFTRPTNNAGGIEAGMSNSQPIVVRAAVKPICTLANPLESVNVITKRPQPAPHPRGDVCAVPAASCVVENVVAFEIARAMIDKFGGDSLDEMKQRWDLFHRMARDRISR